MGPAQSSLSKAATVPLLRGDVDTYLDKRTVVVR